MAPVCAAGLSITTLALYGILSLRPVMVEVSPSVAFAPADVQVTVRVQPQSENRGLYVEADGETYRSSFVQLEGDRAPIVYWIDWRNLEAGDYVVRASVASSVKVLASDHTRLRVVSRE